MKVTTPEISWHAKEAIYSLDLQPCIKNQPRRLATGGIDSNVRLDRIPQHVSCAGILRPCISPLQLSVNPRIWELQSKNKSGVSFLSNLSRHDAAVNVVRFSKSGLILASGGDDGAIILWKLSEKNAAPNIFEDESDIGQNVETWTCTKMLRGHLEDINEISWSSDEKFMISGSIDHTAIVWDVVKGGKTHILAEAKHFIHGVAWDPLGEYLAALSCDRSLRIYSIKNQKVLHNVNKMIYPTPNDSGEPSSDCEDVPVVKPQRMFHDESVVRRRLEFTSDGNLLIVPAGCLATEQDGQSQQINTAYIFTRGCLNKPASILLGFKQPVTVIRCCPLRFQLRSDLEEDSEPVMKLPYRLIFAVASSDTLLLYDTQHLAPFALVGNIHYAAITDVAWSSDAQYLVASSRDGFCTVIKFDDTELGVEYVDAVEMEVEETQQPAKEDKILCNGIIEGKETSKDIPILIDDDSTSSAKMPEIGLEEVRPITDETKTNDIKEKGEANMEVSENSSKPSSKIIEPENISSLAIKDSNTLDEVETPTKNKEKDLKSIENSTEKGGNVFNSKSTENNVKNQINDKVTSDTMLPLPSSQENKPRRVNLITVSQKSPASKSPLTPKRRVKLMTVSDVPGSTNELKTPTNKQRTPHQCSPAITTPNSNAGSPKNSPGAKSTPTTKKPPRRIQLTPVTDNA